MSHAPQDTPSSPSSRHRRGGARRAIGIAALVLTVGAVAAGGAALAQMHGGFMGWHGGGQMRAMGGGWHHHGGRLDLVLDRLDATTDQRQRIAAVADAAIDDLIDLRAQVPGLMRDFGQELAKPAIDRTALEALRARQLGTAEAASRRLVEAMADAAEILTPEQRAKLGANLRRFAPIPR